MVNHIRTNTPRAQFFHCHRCRLDFANRVEYSRHINNSFDHHPCNLCRHRTDFNSFTGLQRHLEAFHLYCEPCQWFAPSTQGLRQHNTSRHFMCVTCGDYFNNQHQLSVHAFVHRPFGVRCFGCNFQFPILSALYGHFESSRCPSGITSEDIQNIAAGYVRNLADSNGFIFYCRDCQRGFNRMCDLLQHSETRTCPAGYWGGSARVGLLVQYMEIRLRNIVESRRAAPTNGDPTAKEEVQNEKVISCCPGSSLILPVI
ncbi:conserved hypothetical protein [Coccidioides posadasii str. Silveira]|uniref:C2H2-type domain-containing protein n=2 Tax=Coccidioides posadasii TaxID=199306 RepID=E9D352_COCPS|nr:conserved hypothetical protein [Coccidioides posadasii str. Silveira]KMM71393.1 hypothetical protein CPAG_07700 [Coccidioides posadasii RMSCC 3488]